MHTLITVIILLVLTNSARAEIMVGVSLEWLADTSTSIGLFQVSESQRKTDNEFELTFRLYESLKGDAPESAKSRHWVRVRRDTTLPTIEIGDSFLLFFKLNEKESLRIDFQINLSDLQNGGINSVAIKSNFEVLTEETQILELVRQRIESHPNATIMKWNEYPDSRFDVEVPREAPAFKVLFGKSACYLLVPDDLKPEKPNKADISSPTPHQVD